jgi:hypothetical protein
MKTPVWLLALALMGTSRAAGANTDYSIDFTIGTDTVTGSIALAGASTITASDITGYSLEDSLGISVSMAADGAAGCVSACGLTVDGRGLTFDFGSPAYGELDFPVGLDSPNGFALLTAASNQRGLGFLNAEKGNSPHFEYSNARVVLGEAAAPEIDPAGTASAVTLLLGGLMILRAQRVAAIGSDIRL